ncbi:MAG: universal stress protein, partial [Clostridia bacterium]|nr:universal stress protein [Clostridia bacterium]
YIEPHTRPETMQLVNGLPSIEPKVVQYKNIQLKEFNLDAALERKPEVILVDELAHSNVEGVRNKKRYQDIEELLNAGIDVYTTVNVQHIESLNDIVQDITKVFVRETIPDYIFDYADKVKLIDIEPDELLRRFEEGKVYRPDRAATAMNNFFTKENLRLLREIAMRKAADRISHVINNDHQKSGKNASIKLLVCISPSPSSAKCIRWAARTAEAFHSPWVAVYVENVEVDNLSTDQQKNMRQNLDLAERLGAEVVVLNGYDVAAAIAQYVKLSGITNIVVGKSRKKTIKSLFEMDFEDKLVALMSDIEVHIIPDTITFKPYKKKNKALLKGNLSFSWRDTFVSIALLIIATLVSFELNKLDIGEQNIIMMYIL